MSRLIMMMGIPGCGKSTFAKKLVKWIPNTKIVSRDEIRFELLGECDDYFKHEKQVWKKYVQTINKYLNEGFNVIIDATHINRQSRAKVLKEIDKNAYNRCDVFYMRTPIARCLSQNAKREGRARVPEKVIRDFWNRKSTPILEEGFNNIYYVFDCNTVRTAQGKDDPIE